MAAKKKAASRKPATKSRAAKFDLEARLAGLPADAGERAPDMPAAALGKDGVELARVVKPYVAKIVKLPGFQARFVNELGPLAEALLEADLDLQKKRKAAAKKTGGAEPVAEAARLRTSVISGARYLFRTDADLIAELDAIAEGEGLDDLIKDLKDLAKLGDDNPKTFALDESLPADLPGTLRAAAERLIGRTDTSEVAAAIAHRNRCFWAANEAFDEVYAALGFVLRGKDVRLSDLFRPYRTRNMMASRSRAARAQKKAPVNG